MSPRILAISAGVLALCGVAAVAQAQVRAEPAVERVQERRVYVQRDGHRDMTEHLRAILQLRPNQDAALQAYVAAARPGERHVERIDVRGRQEGTTTERLARMEEGLARQQAQTRAFIDATRRFYDQLDPAQKRAFDEMPMLMVDVNVGPMLLPIAHVPPMPPIPPMPPMPRMPRFDGEPPIPPTPPVPPRPPL